MKTKPSFLTFFVLIFAFSAATSAQEVKSAFSASQPVFQVDAPSPTADKPQSKLWFMDGCWWALLPRASGPSLWQRSATGWVEHPEVARQLEGTPGRADVWANESEVVAVGVGTNSLTVTKLSKKGQKTNQIWESRMLATLLPPNPESRIETATIAQDKAGRWWVAAVADGKVCVWRAARRARNWTNPILLAEGLDKDDICVVTELPEGVGVVWSNQTTETVVIRVHQADKPSAEWEPQTVIESGNATADDHLNTALSPDGTLWVASKNSLDVVGEPQLVLRVRAPTGQWYNYPYAPLLPPDLPSRPAVVAAEGSDLVLAGHTIYNKKSPNQGRIVFGRIDTTQAGVLVKQTDVIAPETMEWSSDNRINDITGPKKPFPQNAPWIILASDREGRVYEADLRQLIDK